MTAWTRQQINGHRADEVDRLPPIDDAVVVPVVEGIDIWDSWPIRTPDGSVAKVCGRTVWVALAAPASGNPVLRHDVAEHRAFLANGDGTYTDLGPLFRRGDVLGTRQWAGSTRLDGDRLDAYYTAVGVVGDGPPGFRQRLAAAAATVDCSSGTPRFIGWSSHREILQPDPRRYDSADEIDGAPGFIKAFRDPFPFIDPASGEQYLLFTASLAPSLSTTDFNGAVGVARRRGEELDDWELLDPLLTADGVNNELERPHVVVRGGRYYLFFSTQGRTFHPDLIAPTGLYGFVGESFLGPYQPLNSHGMVFTNPVEQPFQAYSWLVLDDLSVVGFVDSYGVEAEADALAPPELFATRRRSFGGTFSPTVHIGLDGNRAWLTTG